MGVVAATVGDALRKHGIRGVLTGGACASLHSGGEYQSVDIDYVLSGRVTQGRLDEAMRSIGFVRKGDRYVHPRSPYFVEFPRGPLAVGADHELEPLALTRGRTRFLALSPTDSCRDRLAAYYHWNDRQALDAAVAIAARREIDWRTIREWSASEGQQGRYQEFRHEVLRRRRGRKVDTKRTQRL